MEVTENLQGTISNAYMVAAALINAVLCITLFRILFPSTKLISPLSFPSPRQQAGRNLSKHWEDLTVTNDNIGLFLSPGLM